jgi:ParB-like chromosome segregation protein Spo0J
MKIKTVHISELKTADYHPRKQLKPGDAIYEKLSKSIRQFDYVDPIIWNERTGNIVGGHQRLEILKSLGHEFVDVSVVSLPIEDEKH